jgi:hypothetical protein
MRLQLLVCPIDRHPTETKTETETETETEIVREIEREIIAPWWTFLSLSLSLSAGLPKWAPNLPSSAAKEFESCYGH